MRPVDERKRTGTWVHLFPLSTDEGATTMVEENIGQAGGVEPGSGAHARGVGRGRRPPDTLPAGACIRAPALS